MPEISNRLDDMGLALPQPITLPAGMVLPFSFVRIHGNRAMISGHVALNPDGSLAPPFGKVGDEVSLDQSYAAAWSTALATLSSLQRELGDLDRIVAWLRVFGMVNTSPDFDRYPEVINGFSDLIIALFGKQRGAHARSAIGVAGLPFNAAIELEAEVEIRSA